MKFVRLKKGGVYFTVPHAFDDVGSKHRDFEFEDAEEIDDGQPVNDLALLFFAFLHCA